MRLEDERESDNFEDRRGGGGMRKAGGIGVGTVVIALVASYFLGVDPSTVISVAQQVQGPPTQSQAQPIDPAKDPDAALKSEMRKVLAKTEDTWGDLFRQMGGQYQTPKLVAFSGRTGTACGAGDAAMGPFYCPGDRMVYLDMNFFREMEQRFKAGGDFARAYVIAHEIGHHVQNLTGITQKTDELRGRMSQKEYNRVSVRVELQADCFAGVWAHHAERKKSFLDPNDVDEALRAANAIGDDMLQKQSRGVVVPDSFTHGSSAQRIRWFKTGFETGSMKACDTFAARDV
ncbi:MAG: neutral zinc metallopeptidase [Betaproteobacteria bacterium]|nr:neutral zinc metallopeptidase [Betaproteobacteria bacterium]